MSGLERVVSVAGFALGIAALRVQAPAVPAAGALTAPEATISQWIVSQGIGAVLAFVMFLIYRKDAKESLVRLSQTAEAYMKFGAEYAAALTKVSDTVARQAGILERIEGHLSRQAYCPVAQVSSEYLRGVADDGPRLRAGDRVIAEVAGRAAERVPRLDGAADGGGA